MKLLDEALDFVIVPIKHSDARHDGAVFKVFVLNAAFFVKQVTSPDKCRVSI